MENLNGFHPELKKSKSDNYSSSIINRTLRKYYGQLQSLMFRQTLSDKRRALFGKDPFAA